MSALNITSSLKIGSLALLFALTGCASSKITLANSSYTPASHAIPSGNATPNLQESSKINTDLSAAYLQSGQPKVALEVINIAIAANPQNPSAHALKGLILADLNNAAEGDNSFRTAIQLAAKDPNINHNYGIFLCKNGRAVESLDYFKTALSDPMYDRRPTTYIAIGNCLLKLGQTDKARQALQEALKIKPFDATGLHSLAKLEFISKNYSASRASLEKLTATNGESPQAIYLGVQIAEKTGNEAERKILERTLSEKFPKSEENERLRTE